MKAVGLVLIALGLLILAACGGGANGGPDSDGWPEDDRTTLIRDCIKYVIAEGDLSNSYAGRYCECWVGGMEEHYTAEYADTIINEGAMPDPEVLTIGMECLSH